VTVDSKGFVWIAGRGKDDNQILNLRATGKFVMQIGRSAQSKGNTDTTNVNLPADVTIMPGPTKSLLRMVTATGASSCSMPQTRASSSACGAPSAMFRRIRTGGGFRKGGKARWATIPTSGWTVRKGEINRTRSRVPSSSRMFTASEISNDGLVYVCDRSNQRVQVFTLEGEYLAQVFISRGHMTPSTATGTLFANPA